jgi:hypothetical protein
VVRVALAVSALAGALTLAAVGSADPRPAPPAKARAAPKAKPKPKLKARKTVRSRGTAVRLDPDAASHPSFKYGAMSADACRAELDSRSIAFTPVDDAPGVLAPVRLPGGVNGVVYRTDAPASVRPHNPFDVFDCRLVLALSDFSKVLLAHDIDEVVMFSAWRPPPHDWPNDKLGTRHPGGLAIDAARFGKKLQDGETTKTWLDVAQHFPAAVGVPPCEASGDQRAETKELRSIVCEAADQHLFTSMLTPNFNREHFNHFHLEVTPDVSWSFLR